MALDLEVLQRGEGVAFFQTAVGVGRETWDALLAEVVAARAQKPRWRHRKRGTCYTEVGRGTMQCATLVVTHMERVVIYRGDDGALWCRGEVEFEDGRFERVEI